MSYLKMDKKNNNNDFAKFFRSEDYILLKNSLFNYKFRKYMLHKAYKRYNFDKNSKILDIGCGISPVSPNMEKTIFVESDKSAVKRLKKMNYDALVGDVKKIPLSNKSVSMIFCSEVLEHVPNYERGLDEFYRVLENKGLLFITVPIHKKYWDFDDKYVGHLRRFDPDKLAEELKKINFKILEVKPIGSYIERNLTKLLVKKAINRKDNAKITSLQIKFFKFLNNIFFALTYFGYLISNKNNSSIILIVAKKEDKINHF